jgi:hypothetical protein
MDIGMWPQFLVVLAAYIVTEVISFKMILKNVDSLLEMPPAKDEDEES